jgi:hypothetical protein
LKYNHLIFGTFNIKEVRTAVNWDEWQRVRVEMLSISTECKLKRCERFLRETMDVERAKVCVTNYIYALKRGGLL